MNFLQSHSKVIFFLLFAVIVLHGQTIFNQYMLDDYIFLDPTIQGSFSEFNHYFKVEDGRHYIPLYYLVNIPIFRHLGQLPVVVHVINLLFYSCSIISIYYLIRTLTKDNLSAFLTTLLFVLHPINAFIIQYATANFVFIATSLTIISFLFYIQVQTADKLKWIYYLAAIIAYGLSILTSEISVILPVFFFLYHFCIQKESLAVSLIKKPWPFWIIACAHVLFYISHRGDTMNFGAAAALLELSPQTYIASFTHLATWYLGSLFNPKALVFIQSTYPVTENTNIYISIFLTLTMGAIYLTFFRWKRDIKTFFLLFFLSGFCFVAVAMLSHYHMGLVIEPHWLYLCSIGFFALFVQFILWVKSIASHKLYITILICILGFFALETVRNHQLTKIEKIYLMHWVKYSPNNFIPWMRLANVVAKEERFNEAILFAQTGYQSAAYDKFLASLEVGKLYFSINALDQAEKYFLDATKIKPEHPLPYFSLAELYQFKKDEEKAEYFFGIAQEKYDLLFY